MSISHSDHEKPGVLNTAKRILRYGSRSTNESASSLKPISENRPLTGVGLNDKDGDHEKDGFIPSGTTGASPKDPKDEEEEDRNRRRDVRTLPPWIHSFEEGEDDTVQDARSYLLPHIPKDTQPPHHHYIPTAKPNAEKGRRYDAGRTWEPDIIRTPLPLMAPHWQSFTAAQSPPQLLDQHGVVVDEQWKRENFNDLEGPWNPGGSGSEKLSEQGWWLFSPARRSATADNVHRTLMQNPFVPLGLRLGVLIIVLCALAVGTTIYQRTRVLIGSSGRLGVHVGPGTDSEAICEQQASTYLSFIVDSVAVLYLVYITWDEYFSKPLGLRRSRDKMRLLFLDLIFIVFSSANLSLAFRTLTDQQWACYQYTPVNQNNDKAAQSVCIQDGDLCRRQQTLAGLLLIVLVAWLATFAVSVLRVVEQISR